MLFSPAMFMAPALLMMPSDLAPHSAADQCDVVFDARTGALHMVTCSCQHQVTPQCGCGTCGSRSRRWCCQHMLLRSCQLTGASTMTASSQQGPLTKPSRYGTCGSHSASSQPCLDTRKCRCDLQLSRAPLGSQGSSAMHQNPSWCVQQAGVFGSLLATSALLPP